MKKILLGVILFFSFGSLSHATCLKTVTTALTEVQTCGAKAVIEDVEIKIADQGGCDRFGSEKSDREVHASY